MKSLNFLVILAAILFFADAAYSVFKGGSVNDSNAFTNGLLLMFLYKMLKDD